MARTLSPGEARRHYERHAFAQDRQGWYEDPALERLAAGSDLSRARAVLEVGCGTGRFAETLVSGHLPPGALYVGIDIAWAMLARAGPRLAHATTGSAHLIHADATLGLPLADRSVDRVIVAYVLDLLSTEASGRLLDEARRVLRPGGRLCLASLTRRSRGLPHLVAAAWSAIHSLAPGWVGGCRPVAVAALVRELGWQIERHDMVAPYGVASEIVIARLD